jgi:arginine exporter protein ArgO
LLGIVLLAALGTGALFVVSLLAYRQRQSRTYLLVTAAVGALVLRSVVGIGTVLGYTPMFAHHIVEHTFDFLIAALILYAALRRTPSGLDGETADLQTDGGRRQNDD